MLLADCSTRTHSPPTAMSWAVSMSTALIMTPCPKVTVVGLAVAVSEVASSAIAGATSSSPRITTAAATTMNLATLEPFPVALPMFPPR